MKPEIQKAVIGGATGFESGTQTYRDFEIDYISCDMEGSTYGVFAGYNFQSGKMVFGTEVAYSFTDMHEIVSDVYQFTDVIDLKGRVGFAAGNALIYDVVGGSFATWDQNGTDFSAAGYNYGAGVDFKVSDRFFVGAEYLMSELDSEIIISNGPDNDFVSSIGSIQVRAGISF